MKNILSLFDGISGAQIALERAGIKYDNYFASETDKYAISITQKHYPKTIQLGNVEFVNGSELPDIWLLIGGSPCTSLSCAAGQKESGLEKGASVLFWEYVRILNEVKPKYFLLENVASMKKADRETITKIIGIEPIMINSALVSAQHRKRLYWTNIKGIEQPEDKHIYLKDVLESGYTEKEKSYPITATINAGIARDYLLKSQRQMVFNKPVRVDTIGKGGQGERIYSVDGKSVCLSANGGGRGAKTGLYAIYKHYASNINYDKSFTLGSLSGNIGSSSGQSVITDIDNFFDKFTDKSCFDTKTACKSNVALEELKPYIRKLTPLECERLQTLPENYTKGISSRQRYKAIGNGFTIDVIAHIIKNIGG